MCLYVHPEQLLARYSISSDICRALLGRMILHMQFPLKVLEQQVYSFCCYLKLRDGGEILLLAQAQS